MTSRATSIAIADLPAPVAGFVRAVNDGDMAAMLSLFADDALVNDELVDHWGTAALSAWAEREIFGKKLALQPAGAVAHHGHIILTAGITGTFDRAGLPDPLLLSFNFALADGRIAQLIILPSQMAS